MSAFVHFDGMNTRFLKTNCVIKVLKCDRGHLGDLGDLIALTAAPPLGSLMTSGTIDF